MRRLVLAMALALVALFAVASTASASTYCSLDPTVGPLTFGASLGSSGLSANLSL